MRKNISKPLFHFSVFFGLVVLAAAIRWSYVTWHFVPHEPRAITGIVGSAAQNLQGDRLGKVVNVTIDADGRPGYFIISYGGTMRMAPLLTAVPWSNTKVHILGGRLILDISKEKFFNAPHYSNLQDLTQQEEVRRIRAYFGTTSWAICPREAAPSPVN